MPPIPPSFPVQSFRPRVILYQQTHHHLEHPISLLPLLTAQPVPALSHLILAAIHINDPASGLTLNDHPPNHPRFTQLWDEVVTLQDSGIKVMCMLGGAAQGSFTRLDYHPSELASLPDLSDTAKLGDGTAKLPAPADFGRYYAGLRDFIRDRDLDGIDLDVEEPTSLHGIIHLIDRLRSDFGGPSTTRSRGFIITLSPVATAMISGMRHLSGFDYLQLERLRGPSIDWYNLQFYNGWGSLEDEGTPAGNGPGQGWYDHIVGKGGWRPERVVVGLLTNPRHGGSGYVGWEVIARRMGELIERYDGFGGVMGWEYWGAVPELEGAVASVREHKAEGEEEEGSHYWRWAWRMRWIMAMKEIKNRAIVVAAGRSLAGLTIPTQASGF